MIARSGTGKQRRFAGGKLCLKMLGIAAAFDIQRGRNLTINAVIDAHIYNAAAQIYNGLQFIFYLRIGMADFEDAGTARKIV